MAKFDAGTAVETLDYDFTAFGGGEGTISEPTTGQVNGFFKDMKKMIKEVKALQKQAKGLEAVDLEEDLTDEQVAETMGKMDEAEAGADQFQHRTIEALARLCGASWEVNEADPEDRTLVGGSPSMEQLQTLPYRHLQAFSEWLMGEIRPKKTTPGTGP